MDKAVVFIDNGYFSKILKKYFGEPDIAYETFSDLLCKDEYKRLRTYVYDCMPYQSNPPTSEEKKRYSRMDEFVHTIKNLPRFEFRKGRLQKIVVGNKVIFKQKMVDVLLSVDLVRLSWSKQIQAAILVAGDSDYVPAVEAARDAGVLVILYYKKPVHNELLEAVDEHYEITNDLIQNSLRKSRE